MSSNRSFENPLFDESRFIASEEISEKTFASSLHDSNDSSTDSASASSAASSSASSTDTVFEVERELQQDQVGILGEAKKLCERNCLRDCCRGCASSSSSSSSSSGADDVTTQFSSQSVQVGILQQPQSTSSAAV